MSDNAAPGQRYCWSCSRLLTPGLPDDDLAIETQNQILESYEISRAFGLTREADKRTILGRLGQAARHLRLAVQHTGTALRLLLIPAGMRASSGLSQKDLG